MTIIFTLVFRFVNDLHVTVMLPVLLGIEFTYFLSGHNDQLNLKGLSYPWS